MEKIKYKIGIDLGTTNTVVAYMQDDNVKLLKFDGRDMLPSVFCIGGDNEVLIGIDAKKYMTIAPLNGVISSKSFMGDTGKFWYINSEKYSPTDIARYILRHIKQQFITKLELDEDQLELDAVVTFPAEFNSLQSNETKKAAIDAGFNVLQMFQEPSAAAIANIKENSIQNEKVFIIDLGGGTFDICVLETDNDGKYKVLKQGGDRNIGGDNFDKIIFNYCKNKIEEDHGIDLTSLETSTLSEKDYYRTINLLKDTVIDLKVELSEEDNAKERLTNLFTYKNELCSPRIKLERDKFDELCSDLFSNILFKIQTFFMTSTIKPEDIDKIILAGGSCYMTKIKEDVENFFGKPIEENGIDRSHMVAIGACHLANAIDEEVETSFGDDIISHSLGISIMRDDGTLVLSKLIEAGELYPCDKEHIFYTADDNQTAVEIAVYEAGSNKEDIVEIYDRNGQPNHDLYGSFLLDNLPLGKKGENPIIVSFNYDKNRSIIVTAKDVNSGKSVVKEASRNMEKVYYKTKNYNSLDFVLLLDVSGSMIEDICIAKKAINNLVDEVLDLRKNKAYRVSLITFGNNASVIVPLTNNDNEIKQRMDNIRIENKTYISEAIEKGIKLFDNSQNDKVMIIITDGNPDDKEATQNSITNAIKNNVEVIIISVGDNCSELEMLKRMNNSIIIHSINDINKLADKFKDSISMFLTDKK